MLRTWPECDVKLLRPDLSDFAGAQGLVTECRFLHDPQAAGGELHSWAYAATIQQVVLQVTAGGAGALPEHLEKPPIDSLSATVKVWVIFNVSAGSSQVQSKYLDSRWLLYYISEHWYWKVKMETLGNLSFFDLFFETLLKNYIANKEKHLNLLLNNMNMSLIL